MHNVAMGLAIMTPCWLVLIPTLSSSNQYDTHGTPKSVTTQVQMVRLNSSNGLRQNPHRLNLGLTGLNLTKGDEEAHSPTSLRSIRNSIFGRNIRKAASDSVSQSSFALQFTPLLRSGGRD